MKKTIFASLLGAVFCTCASVAEDMVVGSDSALDADTVVDGTLTVASGATLDLNGHELSVGGLAGGGTIVNSKAKFKYWRFKVDAIKSGGNGLHISEVKLFNGAEEVTRSANRKGILWESSTFNNSQFSGFRPEKALDGNLGTSWFDDRAKAGNANIDDVWVTIEYYEPQMVTRYEWWTTDDQKKNGTLRIPVSWRLLASNDNETWTEVEIVVDKTDSTTENSTRAYVKTVFPEISSGASIGFSGSCEVPVCIGDDTLVDDCDLRSFGSSLSIDGVLNLAGHKLRVCSLHGEGFVVSAAKYKYWRFQVDRTKGAALHISKISLFNGAADVTSRRTQVLWDDTAFPTSGDLTNYKPEKALDGSLNTSWYDERATPGNANADRVWVTLEYAEPQLVTRYEWYMASDAATYGVNRVPKSWRLMGSNDNESWTEVDVVVDMNIAAVNKGKGYDKVLSLGEEPGELHVDVPEGVAVTNSSIALYGDAKLVKDGLGTYVVAKSGQAYAGGAVVNAGYLKPGVNQSELFGFAGSFFEVKSGAQYCDDIYAPKGTAYLNLAIAGDGPDGSGAIRTVARAVNKVNNADVPWGASLTLAADATIGSDEYAFDFVAYSTPFRLELNGHTLNLQTALAAGARQYPYFLCANVQAMGEGTIVVNNNLQFYPYMTSASVLTNVTLVITENASYYTDYGGNTRDMTVSNFVYRSTAATAQAVQTTTVWGSYAPVSTTSAPKVVLGDATHLSTTLDLSCRTTPFDISFGGGLSFAAGSRVGVKIGSRPAGSSKQILAWTSVPAGISFSLLDAKGSLIVKDDGLYFTTGLVVSVR